MGLPQASIRPCKQRPVVRGVAYGLHMFGKRRCVYWTRYGVPRNRWVHFWYWRRYPVPGYHRSRVQVRYRVWTLGTFPSTVRCRPRTYLGTRTCKCGRFGHERRICLPVNKDTTGNIEQETGKLNILVGSTKCGTGRYSCDR